MPDTIELYKPGDGVRTRLTLLLWGKSGCGKTTLAATAPGRKLWMNFDPDGTAVLADCADNIDVWDLSDEPPRIVPGFKNMSGVQVRNLDKLLKDDAYDTLVFDSITSFGEMALEFGVEDAAGTKKGRNSTLEEPGYSGFGRKNTWMLQCIRTLLRLTRSYNMHCVFIGHEGAPEKDEKTGNIVDIPLLLGGTLRETVPINISEVWIMTDEGGKRQISVRSKGFRKGGKTRMFKAPDNKATFTVAFDVHIGEGKGIAAWYDAWKENGYRKVALP